MKSKMKAYPFLPILINFDVFNKLSKLKSSATTPFLSTERSWYKDAVAKQGGIVVTEPYKAKGNGHIVVIFCFPSKMKAYPFLPILINFDVFNKLSKLKSSATTLESKK
jgi:hypothetical protein